MASYDKELKRSKDGTIIRYVGYNAQGVPEKFRLGYDMDKAKFSENLIRSMWVEIEGRTRKSERASWDASSLKAAKEIAKGRTPIFPKRDYEDAASYARRLQAISAKTGTSFEPTIPFLSELGIQDLRNELAQVRQQLSTATNVVKPVGVTLAKALDAYEIVLRKESTLPTGALTPWGKTQVDQLKSVKTYLADNRFGSVNFIKLDLTEITYNRADEIYGVFRKRPLTLRSKLTKRMTPSSAKNLIKVLGNFFDWLDGEDSFEWTFPRRFHSISKTPDKETPAELYDRRIAKQQSVIPDENLKVLFEYALPIERLIMLLGLNCAFGASEIGQLRSEFVRLDEGIIEGIRFKSGNETKHKLWRQSVIGLRWFVGKRAGVKPKKEEHRDVVFLTERGRPMWHSTAKGNTSDSFANTWNNLIERVKKDKKGFPKYSFNKLRKTSATRILKIASAEVASMILAHKTISDDELLHHYTLIPWEKLFEAQLHFEREIAAMLEPQEGIDPWAEKQKVYIGLSKSKEILTLHESGKNAKEIASQVGVSLATVNRHIQAHKVKKKRGQITEPES
jgi:Phage integrase family